MRVIAIVATFNESAMIQSCVAHLNHNDVEVYIVDNESTDGTVDLLQPLLGHGVIGIGSLKRHGHFSLREQLKRKEELCASLDADWFMHVDADELHVARPSAASLRNAFAHVDASGYNSVNFLEYTFVPVREHPAHDPASFQQTMRWYYPFLPSFPHRVNAWKRQNTPVDLSWSGGHRVRFPGLKLFPRSFVMRHYLFLSLEHAEQKYGTRRYAPDELRDGWSGGERSWRHQFNVEKIRLPSKMELREFNSDDLLDASDPRRTHFLDELTAQS